MELLILVIVVAELLQKVVQDKMVCYIVPTVAAIAHFFMRKKFVSMNNKHHAWLNLLFLGGAVFGFVDHLWNGELFYGGNLVMDLALGVVITLAILLVWKIIVVFDKASVKNVSLD
jgi:hypothetical protein